MFVFQFTDDTFMYLQADATVLHKQQLLIITAWCNTACSSCENNAYSHFVSEECFILSLQQYPYHTAEEDIYGFYHLN